MSKEWTSCQIFNFSYHIIFLHNLPPANFYFIVILDSSNATVYHSTDSKRAISSHGVWYSCSSRTILLYWQYNSQVTYNFSESCTLITNFLHRPTLFLGDSPLIWFGPQQKKRFAIWFLRWPDHWPPPTLLRK